MTRADLRHERGRALLVLGLIVLAARAATFGNPALGYDEQYYLLVGSRMLDGAMPYVDIWDRKPIGLFLIYAACRMAGGDGVLQYQLAAAIATWATAVVLWALARPAGGRAGALAAAISYVLWLNFTEGEGGQSAVFYNLPMALAAGLVIAVLRGCAKPRRAGLLAMLLCGLAIQIKYSVIFEGAFFGLALLWAAWRRGVGAGWLAMEALLLATTALLPTALAAGAFWRAGALEPFIFANFASFFGKAGGAWDQRALGWALAIAILAPLWIAALLPDRRALPGHGFVRLWLASATIGLLPFLNGPNPNPLPPILLPLAVLAAPALDRSRRITLALLVTIFAVGQVVLAATERQKGTPAQARALARAATPTHGGCLFVYDGYPALYHLTRSCLPTRYAFPGLLNTRSEDSAAALGVSPEAEVARILRARPEKIADVQPTYSGGNPRTRALVQAALARDYRLSYAISTGSVRRLIYTRRDVAP